MVDKSRKSGRPAGPKAGFDRTARPGSRPRHEGQHAGKPERGPARPRKVAGVDLNALDRLGAEGLLSREGHRLREQGHKGDAQFRGPKGRGPQPRGERPQQREDRPGSARLAPPMKRGERPTARPGRPAFAPGRPALSAGRQTFADEHGGFASVDEQLVRSFGRGAKPGARRLRGQGPKRTERPSKPVARGVRRLNPAEAEVAERLHKVMARAGVASRRHSEELIQAGRVTVNGQVVTELGVKVIAGKDLIEVDGRPLGKPENLIYLLLNKPKGVVTTLYDPQNRTKVTDLLGEEIAQRVYPVGRLDYDTEGLLLLTNDGDLANGLMHPAKQVKKTYIAKVRGIPGPAKLRALETGIELDDGITAPAEVKVLEMRPPNSSTISLRIHEGRNRQVRRMFEAIGHEVIHLRRSTLGPLHLRDLEPGKWRELTDQEVSDLYKAVGLRLGGARPPKRAAKSRR